MNRSFRKPAPADDANESAPTEAWLFAQLLLGKPIPSVSKAESEARRKRERLEWLASISTEHEQELRRVLSAEAEARRQRERLEWLAKISTEHERKLRTLLREEADAREARERLKRYAERSSVQEAGWDPAKHPKLGGPPNAGWWATTSGSGGTQTAPSGSPQIRDALYRPDRSPSHIVKVSDKGPSQVRPGGTPAISASVPVTKPQLPGDHRGTWISGTKGHGVFRYNNSLENQQAAIAGKEVRFENQHIAVGGFPPGAYYRGNADAATVEIGNVTGTKADSLAADAEMRATLKDPTWRRPEGYLWNHAGVPGSKKIELIDAGVHEAIAHKGPAAEPRALRRAASARGVTGHAMGALTVYLAARDALQDAGVLQPDYSVAERETYHFVADDGSIFVVLPADWRASAKREFVAGPRKGQTEEITSAQVEEYRKQAEKAWGKYIPGTLLSEPRFIPGTQRKSLPLIIHDKFGIPREAGWIDEKGVHHYSTPREIPT